jgi:hypothetical protein
MERCLACEADGVGRIFLAALFRVARRTSPIERGQKWGMYHVAPCSPRPRKRGSAPENHFSLRHPIEGIGEKKFLFSVTTQ